MGQLAGFIMTVFLLLALVALSCLPVALSLEAEKVVPVQSEGRQVDNSKITGHRDQDVITSVQATSPNPNLRYFANKSTLLQPRFVETHGIKIHFNDSQQEEAALTGLHHDLLTSLAGILSIARKEGEGSSGGSGRREDLLVRVRDPDFKLLGAKILFQLPPQPQPIPGLNNVTDDKSKCCWHPCLQQHPKRQQERKLKLESSHPHQTISEINPSSGRSKNTTEPKLKSSSLVSPIRIRSQLMGPAWISVFGLGDFLKCICYTAGAGFDREAIQSFFPLPSPVLNLSHTCTGISKKSAASTTEIAKGTGQSSRSARVMTVDVLPIFQQWLNKYPDFYDRSVDSFVISMVIDGLASKDFSLDGTKPELEIDYFLDRRCWLSGAEGCPVGACKDAEKICKFRPYCPEDECGRKCGFEGPCDWDWDKGSEKNPGFKITTGEEVLKTFEPHQTSGPLTDAQNNSKGHFLLLAFNEIVNQSVVYHVKSPWFDQTEEQCRLELKLHMYNMQDGSIKMLLTTQNHTIWEPLSQPGNMRNMWETLNQRIGRTRQPSQIILEIIPSPKVPAHIAIDDIRLVDCVPPVDPTSLPRNRSCSHMEFTCSNYICIGREKVCDLKNDCLFGDDETQNCDRMPANTSCTFEDGWCGWTNHSEKSIHWERRNKSLDGEKTQPSCDHTTKNCSGHFLFVSMKRNQSQFNDKALLQSSIFAPPPAYHLNASSTYYNSCQLRFSYHMFGPHMGALSADVIELNPRSMRRAINVWREFGDKGNMWHSVSRPLPKLTHAYYIEFTASRGHRYKSDMALDDVSLSPECVGLGVPQTELRGYNYDVALKRHKDGTVNSDDTGVDPKNTTKYEFTTCNNTGRNGPTQEQCLRAYRDTLLNNSVKIISDAATLHSSGIQIWTVPATKHYSIIAKGASGGRGAESNQMTSHGSIVKLALYLKKNEKIYILVGQEGASVCEQNVTLPPKMQEVCGNLGANGSNVGKAIRETAYQELYHLNNLLGGGGGGGGGTFVWKMDGKTPVPLVIAGGGGGLAYNASIKYLPSAKGFNISLDPQSGSTQQNGAGGGGGWRGPIVRLNIDGLAAMSKRLGTMKDRFTGDENATMWTSAGISVVDGGGTGGLPCIESVQWGAEGGFGGGGGGCTAGGGGGGYVGGNAHSGVQSNGEGGYSYVTKGALHASMEAYGYGHDGQGSVVIIPSLEKACGCDYHCVLLDDIHPNPACVCPENNILTGDGKTCVGREVTFPLPYMIALILACLVIFASVGLLCICLYNRYQRQKVALLRRKMLGGPELQLSRLRAQSGPNGVLTEYNPNYEFGGETYNLTDLKEIPRENLQLVKALGQGAFGEVYQGFYKQRAGDSVEMPVAVKTLPELSSNQAEMDFLMEALIMSKFNHPNIVHFIGVCFDKHPRFIILELLAGGDLKTFLRESRPKPERASTLTMKDLLTCAVDVAKGCRYLEENHFIHRDIAARNCLLTTKGPGRVVKIADFGMARDIYRADYYKKGGKAMLPVKWMPPEAFMDGIFTSKTDVWSYGVLLWEVMSLGYMPYPGRGNQDVMQLVTNGGRLEPPTNCPNPVYGIMTQCWHPIPEERPTFATLLERVGYCLQDPEVVNAPLPVFQRPPSSERDATLMRPNPDESSCLRVVHGHRSSNATSINTELASPNSSTADYLVPLAPYTFTSASSGPVAPGRIGIAPQGDSNEDSNHTLPESQSTQTLLEDEEAEEEARKAAAAAGGESAPAGQSTGITGTTTGMNAMRRSKGIDNGLTLTPSTLKDRTPSPTPTPNSTAPTVVPTPSPGPKPGPYVNVGMRRSELSDEEIRC